VARIAQEVEDVMLATPADGRAHWRATGMHRSVCNSLNALGLCEPTLEVVTGSRCGDADAADLTEALWRPLRLS